MKRKKYVRKVAKALFYLSGPSINFNLIFASTGISVSISQASGASTKTPERHSSGDTTQQLLNHVTLSLPRVPATGHNSIRFTHYRMRKTVMSEREE